MTGTTSKENYRILSRYKEEGFTRVPGVYDKERGNSCRICGWKNIDSGERNCYRCSSKFYSDINKKKTIAGLPVGSMALEDWLVFLAIATQISNGDRPYATIEEYAAEVKERQPEIYERVQSGLQKERQIEDIMYDK